MRGRIYFHYTDVEEFSSCMWKICSSNEVRELVPIAVQAMNDTESFFDGMMMVTYEWKNSCLVNLSNKSMNRVAWIGQASMAIKHQIPEEITRIAWSMLSEQKQFEANKMAEIAIKSWEQRKGDDKCQKIQLELMF